MGSRLHPGDQVAPGRLDHPMDVITHQTERMDLPTGFPASLAQSIQETLPITIRLCISPATMAPGEDTGNATFAVWTCAS